MTYTQPHEILRTILLQEENIFFRSVLRGNEGGTYLRMAALYDSNLHKLCSCVWSLLSDSVYTWVEINAIIWSKIGFVKPGFHILYLLMLYICKRIWIFLLQITKSQKSKMFRISFILACVLGLAQGTVVCMRVMHINPWSMNSHSLVKQETELHDSW